MPIKGFLLFPGQGAQTVGMARDVYDAGGKARSMFDEASAVLGFDLAQMVFEADAATLAATENCQPALLVASMALLETAREKIGIQITGAAGLSLGEYTALVALGSINFSDAVRLVRKRGELMEASGRGQETGMYSIIGLDDKAVEDACAKAADSGVVVPANFNSPGQVVISGEITALKRAAEICKEAGAKRALPLKVSAAFHSPFMDKAREGLAAALAEIEIRPPAGRFVNNADAKELEEPAEIRDSLARQVVSPVRWAQSCRLVLGWGENSFFEVGPGKVCQGLMKRIERSAIVRPISCTADIESLKDKDQED